MQAKEAAKFKNQTAIAESDVIKIHMEIQIEHLPSIIIIISQWISLSQAIVLCK